MAVGPSKEQEAPGARGYGEFSAVEYNESDISSIARSNRVRDRQECILQVQPKSEIDPVECVGQACPRREFIAVERRSNETWSFAFLPSNC